ncbi:MAG: 4-hydroxythreonine-4-phosphate dehydrogenase PdxA [Omnitrophica bacterium RIFCSPHIGHO2_02_FULL_51_18]|nr:MAG: 4-hydroxythreonine-4-phosphate dehydrogenase PdxA [Omnitrophica bacterium RIFCSPHIGHO2_02_FULL_51_18]
MPISRSGKRSPERKSKGERIAVTLGDPAGIGPEVVLKSLAVWLKKPAAKILLLGSARFYADLANRLKLKMVFTDIQNLSQWDTLPACVVPCYFFEKMPEKIARGRFNAALATLAVRSIKLGAALATEGEVDAVVTPPINKASTKKAGFNIPGHTEFLASLSRTKRYEMMLVGGSLRVVLVTRHLALKEVSKQVTRERVKSAITLTVLELQKSFGIRRPKIVVCGLNPHAGEEGRFGREEIDVIAPAVREAQKMVKAELVGPLSPDALFYDAYEGCYDAEICMYHDQGLIPLKMISRGSGVNVTLGLPFVRTSPDHGTAYDIADKFIADPGSMTQALKLAVVLSKNRKRYAPRRG